MYLYNQYRTQNANFQLRSSGWHFSRKLHLELKRKPGWVHRQGWRKDMAPLLRTDQWDGRVLIAMGIPSQRMPSGSDNWRVPEEGNPGGWSYRYPADIEWLCCYLATRGGEL